MHNTNKTLLKILKVVNSLSRLLFSWISGSQHFWNHVPLKEIVRPANPTLILFERDGYTINFYATVTQVNSFTIVEKKFDTLANADTYKL